MTFFFFKQKTAYEMRISDWSSDVCSSDLLISTATPPFSGPIIFSAGTSQSSNTNSAVGDPRMPIFSIFCPTEKPGMRSEEHTSELQSLMRISYAVFCLKKKKKRNKTMRNDNIELTKSRVQTA